MATEFFPPARRWVTGAGAVSSGGVKTGIVWPNCDGTWVEDLRSTASVNHDAVGDCVVIQGGVLIAVFGNYKQSSGLWSSCIRTWQTLKWLRSIHDGKIRREDLWRPIGGPFPDDVLLIHVLSRTSNAHPPGSSWRYSGGEHWPWQFLRHEAMTHETREQSAERLARDVGATLTWDIDPDDGTQRIDGSPYEMAKFGLLMLREGQWRDRRVFDADLWRMATGGGVTGDGAPEPFEGWQVHLVRDGGRHSEIGTRAPMANVSDASYFAAGGTNRGYVFVDPERELVVSRVRRSGVFIDQFLPDLLTALRV